MFFLFFFMCPAVLFTVLRPIDILIFWVTIVHPIVPDFGVVPGLCYFDFLRALLWFYRHSGPRWRCRWLCLFLRVWTEHFFLFRIYPVLVLFGFLSSNLTAISFIWILYIFILDKRVEFYREFLLSAPGFFVEFLLRHLVVLIIDVRFDFILYRWILYRHFLCSVLALYFL